MKYTRSKIHFLYSSNELQIFKYSSFEQTLCIDTYRINFAYHKMELQGNIAYLWKNKIIMILEHLWIFVRKTTSESRRSCNVNSRSESQGRNHNVVTTLVFGRSNDVGQRCDNVIRRRNQNKTQSCYNVCQPVKDTMKAYFCYRHRLF